MAEHFPHAEVIHPTETIINRHFDELIECVNRRRIEVIAEFRDKLDERRAAVSSRTQTIQQLMDSKVDIQNRMKENLLHSMREEMLERIDMKLRDLQVVDKEVEFVFVCDSRELKESISVLGQLIERNVTSIPNYSTLLQPNISIGETGEADRHFGSPHGVAYDEESRLIFVADQGIIRPSNISVFTTAGQYIDKYCEGIVKKAFGLAISENTAFVTDSELHCIFKFKLPKFTLLTRVGKQGTGLTEFNEPLRLSVYPSSVFVADSKNNRIVVLSIDLKQKQFITHESMTRPHDAKFINDKIYVLSWKDNPCLHIFTLSGDKIGSLITCDRSGGAQVVECYSFCFDKQNNILIGDYSAGNIKVFSKEGELLHTLGDTDDENKTIKPTGITITDSNRIICVSCHTKFGLHIF